MKPTRCVYVAIPVLFLIFGAANASNPCLKTDITNLNFIGTPEWSTSANADTDVPNGATATYKCESGYTWEDKTARTEAKTVTCNSGTWEGIVQCISLFQTCAISMMSGMKATNPVKLADALKKGESVVLTCDEGFHFHNGKHEIIEDEDVLTLKCGNKGWYSGNDKDKTESLRYCKGTSAIRAAAALLIIPVIVSMVSSAL